MLNATSFASDSYFSLYFSIQQSSLDVARDDPERVEGSAFSMAKDHR
jgi:hypothetical protein